MLFIIDMIF